MPKTSKAQLKAVQKYDAEHRAEKQYRNRKSAAATFVRKYGTYADIKDLQSIIEDRLQEENTMIANIEFTSEGTAYQTTIQFEQLNDNNTNYIGGRYVATAAVDIFSGPDIDKDMDASLEWYYTDEDIADAEHVKAWFLENLKHEYQEPEINGFEIEE
ncbi:hypothetical protein LFYK43_11180 [Ligilactobacillus salitolerans]|uniref:Uncharacterized protein n=1 Tax=Ligilactobacillus salitolerans TaxID=1808352 RepID=A0A401IT10_9LACO|nr:hypothetical protein [Ligilactobacillus salitolerans]GBG94659.1 hypothetical protein LFYK43_11180 [Ligilactobacillus salitolerans]